MVGPATAGAMPVGRKGGAMVLPQEAKRKKLPGLLATSLGPEGGLQAGFPGRLEDRGHWVWNGANQTL